MDMCRLPAERQYVEEQSGVSEDSDQPVFAGAIRRNFWRPDLAGSALLLCGLSGIAFSSGWNEFGKRADRSDARRRFFRTAHDGEPHPTLRLGKRFCSLPEQSGSACRESVAKFLFANPTLYPLPNAAPTDGIVANNLQGSTRSYKANNQGDIKIEYDRGASDKVTGFYSMSTAYDSSTAVLGITFPGFNLYPTKVTGANWVHTFSPSLVNSARIGYTRTNWMTGVPTDPTGQFGVDGDQKVGIPFSNQSFEGFSFQNVKGELPASVPPHLMAA